MKALAFVLLVGVFVRHAGANWLASESFSPAAVYYVLGGIWEAVLCLMLLWVVYGYRKSIWRGLASAALVIGTLEGMQASGCRLAITDIKAVPKGSNLCDYATGLPVGAIMFAAYLVILCWHFGGLIRGRSA